MQRGADYGKDHPGISESEGRASERAGVGSGDRKADGNGDAQRSEGYSNRVDGGGVGCKDYGYTQRGKDKQGP